MSMISAAKLPDLRGQWRVMRRIVGENARFSGFLNMQEESGRLRYAETGILQMQSFSSECFRDYFYDVEDARLRIAFPDGKPFLDLRFVNGEARDSHVCGADVYDARFRFRKGVWTILYKVSGPRKNYSIISRMTRQF